MVSQIHSRLLEMKDDKYRQFHIKIVTDTKYPIIGIRIPNIKAYAKQLLKENSIPKFKNKYYEEVLLHGLYIGGFKCDFDQKIKMIDEYLPYIDSWGICDSFVASIKDIKKNKDKYYQYVLNYLKSDKEYIQRYALVVLLNYYIDDNYLKDLYKIIKKQKYNGYYSKMAGAWLLSYLFIHYFEETVDFVSNNIIDEFVLKKGIQKTKDSYRISKKQKDILNIINKS